MKQTDLALSLILLVLSVGFYAVYAVMLYRYGTGL